MTFPEQLNAFFTTPAIRTKLVTLRAIWRDRYARRAIAPKGHEGVDVEALYEHLKAGHPGLSALVESLVSSTTMHLDAVLMVPLRIPLTRSQPITVGAP